MLLICALEGNQKRLSWNTEYRGAGSWAVRKGGSRQSRLQTHRVQAFVLLVLVLLGDWSLLVMGVTRFLVPFWADSL